MIAAAIGPRTILPIVVILLIIGLIVVLSRKKLRDRDDR
jgi:hypothetical protein